MSSIPVTSRPSGGPSGDECPNIRRANPGNTLDNALVALGRCADGAESLMVDCDQVVLGADLMVIALTLGAVVVATDEDLPSPRVSVLVRKARNPRF